MTAITINVAVHLGEECGWLKYVLMAVPRVTALSSCPVILYTDDDTDL